MGKRPVTLRVERLSATHAGAGRSAGAVPGGPAAALRLAACSATLLLIGCAVPQPRGEGQLQTLREPSVKRAYYLYLPKAYVEADEAGRAARRWPLVVTFHGMKPFDVAHSQAREWEQEADRYGFIVVAPVLNAFGVLGEFPLRTLNPTFKSDELAVLAILDHVFATTRADPSNVLSTSWSSGGYMAHYMLNRHPDRFSCLAVRQSNFSAAVLDGGAAARSNYHPVLILSTQNDFGICKAESQEAIKWYEGHGYRNFAWICINRLGHERTPDIAADFFARVCGATPNRPPEVLVRRQAIDGNATGLALLAGNLERISEPAQAEPSRGRRPQRESTGPRAPTQQRPVLVAGNPGAAKSTAPPAKPVAAQPAAAEQPARATAQRGTREKDGPSEAPPLRIRVSSSIGFEPLLVVYSAECPADWYRTADFHWSLNGESLGHGVNGQRTISEPNDYVLELLVVTSDGTEYRATHPIRVLRNVEASLAPTP